MASRSRCITRRERADAELIRNRGRDARTASTAESNAMNAGLRVDNATSEVGGATFLALVLALESKARAPSRHPNLPSGLQVLRSAQAVSRPSLYLIMPRAPGRGSMRGYSLILNVRKCYAANLASL